MVLKPIVLSIISFLKDVEWRSPWW